MPLPAHLAGDHEPCLLEDTQVLHGPEPRHRQLRLELGQRPAITLEEQVEEEPSRGVRECLEHPVVIEHSATICDRSVTCQSASAC